MGSTWLSWLCRKWRSAAPLGAREYLLSLASDCEAEDQGNTAGLNAERTSRVIFAALCVALFNIPLVAWSERSYVPPPPPPCANAYKLPLPSRIYAEGFVYSAPVPAQFEPYADEDNDAQKSPVLLYEEDKPLPMPHSRGWVIAEQGRGRYSLQRGHIYFSSSDNSDPRSNLRSYWLVMPDGIGWQVATEVTARVCGPCCRLSDSVR